MAGEKYLIDIAAGNLPANGASASLTVEVHRDDTGAFANLTPGAYGSRDFLRADEFTTQTVVEPDLMAPILSSPVDEANGATAATGSVSTNEGNGTLYWVATTSATAPSAAQVKLGQDNAGVAATDSGSQAVGITGVQTLFPAPSGLTASTAYTIHFMHEDAAGNPSLVVSGDGFTTAAGATGPSYTTSVESPNTLSSGNTFTYNIPAAGNYIVLLDSIGGGAWTAVMANSDTVTPMASHDITDGALQVSAAWFHVAATGSSTLTFTKANLGSSFIRRVFINDAGGVSPTPIDDVSSVAASAGVLSATLSGIQSGDFILASVIDRNGNISPDFNPVWSGNLTNDANFFMASAHGAAQASGVSSGTTFTGTATLASFVDTDTGNLLSMIAVR